MAKTPRRIFACATDQGEVMEETTMTEEEYANLAARKVVEKIALMDKECTSIRWQDVTENEVCQEAACRYYDDSDDGDNEEIFELTKVAIEAARRSLKEVKEN